MRVARSAVPSEFVTPDLFAPSLPPPRIGIEMNIAGLQPQIFCAIVVILAAAGIAVLVDCLKRKNAKLREAMVELNVRREQERQELIQSRLNAAANVTEKPVIETTGPEQIK